MAVIRVLVLACGLVLWLGMSVAETQTISAIDFSGNTHTRREILLQEMSIHVGDAVDAQAIEQSRQAIMDLGLFKSVSAKLEEGEEGTHLLITVEEKFYFIPLPRIDLRPDGTNAYGLELRVDNIGGLNQRLKVFSQQKRAPSGEVRRSDELLVGYTYPRMVGTPYRLSVNTEGRRKELDAIDGQGTVTANYRREVRAFSFLVSRWSRQDGPSQGWAGGLGLSWRKEAYTLESGAPADYVSGNATSLNYLFGYTSVHEFPYYRSGYAYGYQGNLASQRAGSDFSYNSHLFYYRSYNPVVKGESNLNWQLRLGLANGSAFGSPAYSLGGADTLRGFAAGANKGNAFWLANVEYLRRISGFRQLRGVLFMDVGNSYRGVLQINPAKLKSGVGFGLRWKVQFLVDLTLGWDFAYGVNSGERISYFGTSTTF